MFHWYVGLPEDNLYVLSQYHHYIISHSIPTVSHYTILYLYDPLCLMLKIIEINGWFSSKPCDWLQEDKSHSNPGFCCSNPSWNRFSIPLYLHMFHGSIPIHHHKMPCFPPFFMVKSSFFMVKWCDMHWNFQHFPRWSPTSFHPKTRFRFNAGAAGRASPRSTWSRCCATRRTPAIWRPQVLWMPWRGCSSAAAGGVWGDHADRISSKVRSLGDGFSMCLLGFWFFGWFLVGT